MLSILDESVDGGLLKCPVFRVTISTRFVRCPSVYDVDECVLLCVSVVSFVDKAGSPARSSSPVAAFRSAYVTEATRGVQLEYH